MNLLFSHRFCKLSNYHRDKNTLTIKSDGLVCWNQSITDNMQVNQISIKYIRWPFLHHIMSLKNMMNYTNTGVYIIFYSSPSLLEVERGRYKTKVFIIWIRERNLKIWKSRWKEIQLSLKIYKGEVECVDIETKNNKNVSELFRFTKTFGGRWWFSVLAANLPACFHSSNKFIPMNLIILKEM